MSKQEENQPSLSSKDNQTNVRLFELTQKFGLFNRIVSAIIYITFFYFTYLSIDAIAGKTTIANVFLSYLISKESNFGFPWFLAGVTSIWALLERRLRKRKIEQMQNHIKELEKSRDENRTSSGLLADGETNPSDKIS